MCRPVYVQTTGENNPPLLRKVIVLYKGQVQVADTLPQALQQFPDFSNLPVSPGQQPTQPTNPSQPTNPTPTPTTADPTRRRADAEQLLQQALDAFNAADAALKQSPPDYNIYGQKLQQAQAWSSRRRHSAGVPPRRPTTTVPGGGSA